MNLRKVLLVAAVGLFSASTRLLINAKPEVVPEFNFNDAISDYLDGKMTYSKLESKHRMWFKAKSGEDNAKVARQLLLDYIPKLAHIKGKPFNPTQLAKDISTLRNKGKKKQQQIERRNKLSMR